MDTDRHLDELWIPTIQQIDEQREKQSISMEELSSRAGLDSDRFETILTKGSDPLYSTLRSFCYVVYDESDLYFPTMEILHEVCKEESLCIRKISVDAGLHKKTFYRCATEDINPHTSTVRSVLQAIRGADPEEHEEALEKRNSSVSTLYTDLADSNPEDLGLTPIGERYNA